MNERDATEVAYKNGYNQGAIDLAARVKTECLKISQQSFAVLLVDQIIDKVLADMEVQNEDRDDRQIHLPY